MKENLETGRKWFSQVVVELCKNSVQERERERGVWGGELFYICNGQNKIKVSLRQKEILVLKNFVRVRPQMLIWINKNQNSKH